MVAFLSSRSSGHLSGGLDHPRSARAWTPTSSSRARGCGWNSLLGGCIALIVVSAMMGVFELVTGAWGIQLSQLQHPFRSTGTARGNDVLVMYIFSNTDPQYLDNLKFFLREGVHVDDGCEYIFVVNRSPDEEIIDLPPLPTNARYVLHNNECYDWGTFGWVLNTQGINVDHYSYFVFMNSSVRGPFVPSYIKGHVHWADVLFSKITDEVKLVGPTINCEGSPEGGNPANPWRKNPHVQSYVVATDRIGMQILLDDRNIFKCYTNMWDTIYHSELGSSAAILHAGFNIDSLMVRYQGVDWRDQNSWGCNEDRNPYGAHYLDGGSLEAMEVMFVKVKQRMLEMQWSYPIAATLFDKWYRARDEGAPDIKKNAYVSDAPHYKLAAVFAASVKGMDCFDCPFYRAQNPDLPAMWSCLQLFDHFVNDGQFEGRNSRSVCDIPAAELLPFSPQPHIMNALPHVSPERVIQLLDASGSPRDTPTPRVTAIREAADASATLASTAQESAWISSPTVAEHLSNMETTSRSESNKKGHSVDKKWVIKTVNTAKSFDGSGSKGSADVTTSSAEIPHRKGSHAQSGKGKSAAVSVDAQGKPRSTVDTFASDAQAARASLRSSQPHSLPQSKHSKTGAAESSASGAAKITNGYPRKLSGDFVKSSHATHGDSIDVESGPDFSTSLADTLNTMQQVAALVSTDVHSLDMADGRQLMMSMLVEDDEGNVRVPSYDGRQYLSKHTQDLLLR